MKKEDENVGLYKATPGRNFHLRLLGQLVGPYFVYGEEEVVALNLCSIL